MNQSKLFTSATKIAEKILEASSLYPGKIEDMAIVSTNSGFTWFFEPSWNPQTWSKNRKEGYTLVESVKKYPSFYQVRPFPRLGYRSRFDSLAGVFATLILSCVLF